MQELTAIQRRVLDLSLEGHSATEIGTLCGFSRQRADEVLTTIERRFMTAEASHWATTRTAIAPRRALHGEFIIRSGNLPREDGRSGPDEDRSVVWNVDGWPVAWAWAGVAPVDRPWSMTDTRNAYREWVMRLYRPPRQGRPVSELPTLESDTPRHQPPEYPMHSVIELTKTLAWVIGVKALLYDTSARPVSV